MRGQERGQYRQVQKTLFLKEKTAKGRYRKTFASLGFSCNNHPRFNKPFKYSRFQDLLLFVSICRQGVFPLLATLLKTANRVLTQWDKHAFDKIVKKNKVAVKDPFDRF